MRQASILQPRDFDRCPNKYSKGHGHPPAGRRGETASRLALARSALARAALGADKIPVWSGQVSQRAGFVLSLSKGEGAAEDDARSLGAAEITKLWSAVEKSVEAVNAARAVRAA